MDRLLFSWLGRTDLRAIQEADAVGTGPVSQALDTGRFSQLALICDYSAAEAQGYLDWLGQRNQTPVTLHSVELDSPTNFDAIYREARRIVAETIKARPSPPELTFHLSPGTPAMAAVWIILAKTRFPADLRVRCHRCWSTCFCTSRTYEPAQWRNRKQGLKSGCD